MTARDTAILNAAVQRYDAIARRQFHVRRRLRATPRHWNARQRRRYEHQCRVARVAFDRLCRKEETAL